MRDVGLRANGQPSTSLVAKVVHRLGCERAEGIFTRAAFQAKQAPKRLWWLRRRDVRQQYLRA
jgi:hypothetical protein